MKHSTVVYHCYRGPKLEVLMLREWLEEREYEFTLERFASDDYAVCCKVEPEIVSRLFKIEK
jgi:hypothetical protein